MQLACRQQLREKAPPRQTVTAPRVRHNAAAGITGIFANAMCLSLAFRHRSDINWTLTASLEVERVGEP